MVKNAKSCHAKEHELYSADSRQHWDSWILNIESKETIEGPVSYSLKMGGSRGDIFRRF
jgi:hypothetical protein